MVASRPSHRRQPFPSVRWATRRYQTPQRSGAAVDGDALPGVHRRQLL